VAGTLVIDRTPLAAAEPYGECLTHAAGHCERWTEWQEAGASALAAEGRPAVIASTEYDAWPRGRVVYEVPVRRFVIYADRRLQDAATMAALSAAFGLAGANVIVRSDLHYR
jgi:hypothetical protein